MNKLAAVAAVTLALVATAAATAPSQAFYPKYVYSGGLAGLVLGATIAAAAANDRSYAYDYYDESWADHVDACYSTYKTYSAADDRYTAALDGAGNPIRVFCRL